ILNLAVFFAYHVVWPQGLQGGFDGMAAGLGLAAMLALFRFRLGVITVIAACGAAGLLWVLLRP
ncbi:MAG: chromate transporter, partial [Candidatus Methylumidiphilus sp.]